MGRQVSSQIGVASIPLNHSLSSAEHNAEMQDRAHDGNSFDLGCEGAPVVHWNFNLSSQRTVSEGVLFARAH